LQSSAKKRVIYGAIAFVWIGMGTFVTSVGVLSSDIITGVCVPLRVYPSYVAARAVSFTSFLITYMVPVILMLLCYSRIVYELKHKVTSSCLFSSKTTTRVVDC